MIRNFLNVIRHFKAAFILNLLGLAVAFTAFMMIMMQVNHDMTFDTCYDDAQSIFRLDVKMDGNGQAIVSRPLARLFIGSSPEIEAGCIAEARSGTNFWHIETSDGRTGYSERYWDVSSEILKVFAFRMIEGDLNSLDAPGSAVIPESMARRMFGNSPATGQILHATAEGDIDRTVTGVYRDFPENASLQNIVYTSKNPKENYDNWGNWNYYCFVRLSDPASAGRIIEDFKENNRTIFGEDFSWEEDGFDLVLDPLPDLHFKSAGDFDGLPKANRSTVYALISIAFIILLIAGINFTNFSTALTPMRIKGINTRKVLGSTDSEIRTGLVDEIVTVSVTAYALSLLILYLAGMTPPVSLLDCSMALAEHPGIIAAGACASIVLGILSSLWPAFYMTSVPPAMVLKGSFGLSPAGKRMRNALVGIQFTASFALIIAASFMYLQNRFMLKTPLGFEKDQVIVTEINDKILNSRDAFTEDLKKIAGVENVAFSQFTIAEGDYYMTWGRDYKGENISFTCIPVSHTFLDVMGIEVTEGRNFRNEDETGADGCYIFNETAREQYSMQAGETINGDEIIGFIPDINFASLRQGMSPMAFYMYGNRHWGGMFRTAYIRVAAGTDMKAVRPEIEKTLDRFDPEYPFSVRFYDSILEGTYQKEQRTGSLITLFSLVAIFISIVGVFSLVVFDCQYRRKETAVRKVLGATGTEVTGMFCRTYFILLCVCFAIGAPVAWAAVERWAEGFAYRSPLHWWVFPAAFAAVTAVTILTVVWQSWKTANENPVNNLRSE